MPLENVVACDDGYVKKLGQGYTIVSCIYWNLDKGPLASSSRPVRIDGLDASSIIAGIIQRLRLSGLKPEVLLLDSVTIAGFNVVSPSTIERVADVPTVIVYKYKPSLERLLKPLRKKFGDWKLRARVVAIVSEAREVETLRGKLYVILWGLSASEALALVDRLQLYSRIPEPLRMAHYLASSTSRLFDLGAQHGC